MRKVYPKNSFDRFGDDLTELIVSYLWFEDKVRLECVSKQWRRLVFNKQFAIELTSNRFIKNWNKNSLKMSPLPYRGNQLTLQSVLKKCPNIINVKFNLKEVSSQLLSLIVHYCHRIKSLTYCSYIERNDINVLSFFRMCGHKLERLIISGGYETTIEEILKFCPNVKKLQIPNKLVLFKENKEFLPKLEDFCFGDDCIEIFSENVNKMKIWVNKYSKTLKTLKVILLYMTYEELKTCIDCISRFVNLTELNLCIGSISTEYEQPIDDCLSLIGQKCNKLLKLGLYIDNSISISKNFFDVFIEFKAVKILGIKFESINGSIESLKHCKQLKHLDIHYSEITEDFFINIHLFVPKLQSLNIFTDKELSDSFIVSFHSLKNIQKVFLNELKFWYFGKQLFEVVSNSEGKHVIKVNANCGFIRI